MSKNEKKPLGPNSVDMGERGTYDKRNKLNDLTGKESTEKTYHMG